MTVKELKAILDAIKDQDQPIHLYRYALSPVGLLTYVHHKVKSFDNPEEDGILLVAGQDA